MKTYSGFRVLSLSLLLISSASFAVSPVPEEDENRGFTTAQQEAIGRIAAQYIARHPQVLLDTLSNLCHQKQIACSKLSQMDIKHIESEQSSQQAELCSLCELANNQ